MKYRINLSSQKEVSVVDRTLYFFLNYVRYILVITQLTVIGVLFFRFKVDQNIIDLKDSIDQKKEIIKVFAPSFEQAQMVNTQIASLQSIVSDQNLQNSALNYILSRFPSEMYLKKFQLDESTYTLAGITTNAGQLQQYYELLRHDGRFKIVELSNVRRDEGGYLFTLKLAKYTL